MSGREWVRDLAQELASGENTGPLRTESANERAQAVLAIVPSARFVVFDPEGFNEASDYDEVLEALAELARPIVELGPFEVRSTKDALSFRGLVAGEEVSFALAPITSDWFDQELLVALDRAIAARGVDGRFTTTQIWDWEIVFVTAKQERALQRHPARPIFVDEEIPASDPLPPGEPAEEAGPEPRAGDESDEDGSEGDESDDESDADADDEDSGWTWVDVERPAFLAEGDPTRFHVPSGVASAQPALVGLTRHPRDPHLAVRFRFGDGSTRAMLARPDGEGWFAPEGAADMAWSPDGATTYVLQGARLDAWVWGRDEVRASYALSGRTLTRLIVSPCGRFVALIARARAAYELVVLETRELKVQRSHPVSAPAAVAFSEDGRSVTALVMDDPPTRMVFNGRSKLWLGSFHFIETEPDGAHDVSMWLVDIPAVPLELQPLRFDGRGAVVDLPGWGEVRGHPDD